MLLATSRAAGCAAIRPGSGGTWRNGCRPGQLTAAKRRPGFFLLAVIAAGVPGDLDAVVARLLSAIGWISGDGTQLTRSAAAGRLGYHGRAPAARRLQLRQARFRARKADPGRNHLRPCRPAHLAKLTVVGRQRRAGWATALLAVLPGRRGDALGGARAVNRCTQIAAQGDLMSAWRIDSVLYPAKRARKSSQAVGCEGGSFCGEWRSGSERRSRGSGGVAFGLVMYFSLRG